MPMSIETTKASEAHQTRAASSAPPARDPIHDLVDKRKLHRDSARRVEKARERAAKRMQRAA